MKCAAPLLLLLIAASVTTQADLSTPRSAAKSLFNAIVAGDRAGVLAALYVGDDAHGEYAGALADIIVAGKELGDAARKQFGEVPAGISAGVLDPRDAAKLDQASVEQDGDAAKLIVPDQHRPMSFRRAKDGRWGLVIYDLASDQPADIAKQTQLVRLLAEAMQTSAAEISSGTFRTPDAATTAIQQRLHGVMLSFHRPTTRRGTTTTSTAPTTSPR